jgi:tRNA modification GTPase
MRPAVHGPAKAVALYANSRDTIFALASAAGKSAVAVFRISGPGCPAALVALAPNTSFPVREAVLRILRHPATQEPIDRALITRFEAPSSFTGEDLVEISVTGGRAVISATAQALMLVPGLRPAEPGEFAWRAFVNGKIDLSEVEGLADLVDAETEAQRRQAQRIAGGALSRECEAIRALLIGAMATIEAQIDFSDVDGAGILTLDSVKQAAGAARDRIDRALASARAAGRLREGFVVVIAGPPNVGKSTLINALAGRDVAITSPHAGTTRDLIEVFLDLRGYPVILVDTAGIRQAADPVEREGVSRALRRAAQADLTLWLDDRDGFPSPEAAGQALIVRTKIDRPEYHLAYGRLDFAISAKTGEGIDKLLDAIGDLAEERMASSEPAVLTLERHRQAFQEARESLSSVLAPEASEPELIAEDLRRAAAALDRVVGRIGVEDVLGEIFSRLCVGK